MLLTSVVSENLGILDAALLAVLGYVVVFFGLILLMIVVIIFGKALSQKKESPAQAPSAPTATPAAPVAAPVAAEPQNSAAPGSAGQLKMYDVPPKTAAMLMAIVADKMGKPLNELRFISIKEVK